MTVIHSKLPDIFHTQDPIALKRSLKKNYLKDLKTTNIFDGIPSKGLVDVKYHIETGDFLINSSPLDLEKKISRIQLTRRKIVHYARFKDKKHVAKIDKKADLIVTAFLSAVEAELRRQNLRKMKNELQDLRSQLSLAETAMEEANQEIPIKGIKEIEENLASVELELKTFGELIIELEGRQASFKKDFQKSPGLNKFFKKIIGPEDKKREKLVKKLEEQKARSQSIAGGELKTEEDIQNALILARARIKFFQANKDKYENEILELKKNHLAERNAAKVEAYENWMEIKRQIKILQVEIDKAQNPFKNAS